MTGTYETVDELPDRYFEQPVNNTETGVIEQLQRDDEANEVVITSPETGEEWDRESAVEFTRDLYDPIPESVVNDPVAFVEAVLDGEENPLGVMSETGKDIALSYARKRVEITERE